MQSAEPRTCTSPFMVLHNSKAHPSSLPRCTGDSELLGLGKVLSSFYVTQFMPCTHLKDVSVIQKRKYFDVCVLHYRKSCSEQVCGKPQRKKNYLQEKRFPKHPSSPAIIQQLVWGENRVKQRLQHVQCSHLQHYLNMLQKMGLSAKQGFQAIS